jgi:hypothetical protein
MALALGHPIRLRPFGRSNPGGQCGLGAPHPDASREALCTVHLLGQLSADLFAQAGVRSQLNRSGATKSQTISTHVSNMESTN